MEHNPNRQDLKHIDFGFADGTDRRQFFVLTVKPRRLQVEVFQSFIGAEI